MTFIHPFALPKGYDLWAFDVLDSTNDQCRRMFEGGTPGNFWVVSAKQSSGKGRRGREWVSRQGNLFASLLYGIDCDLETASELSFVTAVAAREVVADILQDNIPVTCKWPNDILVGGKKVAGILLETAGQGSEKPSHVIIGIGINVMNHPENPLYPATNLKKERCPKLELDLILSRLVHTMAYWISQWKDHGFTPVRKAWKAHASGLGQEIIVRLPNEELKGRFVDLDKSGALILEFAGERRHITAGDVFFAEP